MNRIFNFKRYMWLAKCQWYENAASYKRRIFLMILATGLLFWLFVSLKSSVPPEIAQTITFCITGIVFLYVHGATFFKGLSSKHRKMFYFSLPATPLERVAVTFTFVMALMPVIFLTVFAIFDFVFVQMLNRIHDIPAQTFFNTLPTFDTSAKTMVVMVLSQLSIVSIFTLGASIFGKRGPVISIIFMIVFTSVYDRLLKLFYGADSLEIVLSERYTFIYLLPVCWIAMYFVMKKKEA